MNISDIILSDPEITLDELRAVDSVLRSTRVSDGALVEQFEAEFAQFCGVPHGVAISGSTLALVLVLQAAGIGAGDEVIATGHSWHEIAHGILLAGATPVLIDIDYWTGSIDPTKLAPAITPRTKAVLAANSNGHPAFWEQLQTIAREKGILLIEDSTEAIGSCWQGTRVGGFGDCAIFDFSQPSLLVAGQAAMVVTRDAELALKLRHLRGRKLSERSSVVLTEILPWRARVSDLEAALGLAQLHRIDAILAKRDQVRAWYDDYLSSFEGIKPPYTAEGASEVHWMLYTVHLGTRFSRSSRDAIIEDMARENIEVHPYSVPLSQQRRYLELGYRRGSLWVTDKIADRALVLPFHAHLTESHVAFIVGTLKDASINIGAGTAIYL